MPSIDPMVILAIIILLAAATLMGVLLLIALARPWHGSQCPRQPLPKQPPKRSGRLPEITTPTPPMPIYAADGSIANADALRAWYRKEFEARR